MWALSHQGSVSKSQFSDTLLESCSGASKSNGSGTGQGSNAILILTLRAAASPAHANTNLLSFRTIVAGVSLTPETGGSINVPLNSDLYQADFTRLQSDTTLLALSTSIRAGTYTNMVVSLSDPAVTYCNLLYTDSGNYRMRGGQCNHLERATGYAHSHNLPVPLVVNRGRNTGLAINVNIAKALTVNGQTQAITAVKPWSG